MFLSVTLFLTVLIVYYFLFGNRNYWKKRGVNGPTPLPIIGNTLGSFKLAVNDLELERYRKYGRIYGYFELSKPFLTVGEPELIRKIGIQDFDNFQNHVNIIKGDPIFSKMVFFTRDDDWKRIRTIITPTFTSMKMKKMVPLIERCIINTIRVLDDFANKNSEIDLSKTFKAFTVDVMAECAFAVNTNGHVDPENEFLQQLGKCLNFGSWRVILANILPSFIQKKIGFQVFPEDVLSFFNDAVKQVVENRKQSRLQYHDFLQTLIETESSEITFDSIDVDVEAETKIIEKNNKVYEITTKCEKYLDESEILAQCIAFFLAGYETTPNLLYYCVYLLALNPEKQAILYKEVISYLQNNATADYDSLNELLYLDAFINESLRILPPAAHIDRVTSADYSLSDTGIVIPKGTVINFPIYAMHHDPEFFPDPESFKPERFLPENRHEIKPYTFIPFGVGPRQCIGMRFALMNAKLFLIQIVSRYEFIKTENTPAKPVFNGLKLVSQCEPIMLKMSKRCAS